MFRRRVTAFWLVLSVLTVVVVGRLVQIQIVEAAYYEELASRILTQRPEYTSAPRGTIYDRHGTPLLRDEPTWDICLHYAVLAGRGDYFQQLARHLRKRGEYPEDMALRDIEAELRAEVPRVFERLGQLTGMPQAELRERVAQIRTRIERWRARAQRPVREENQLLPVLEDVDRDTALTVRLELERYPWLQVTPGSHRTARDADTVVHVLGRLGPATPDRIANDPLAGDPLRSLTIQDRCGVSGVERLADIVLRGTRGRTVRSYAGQILEHTDPIPGHDVYLTIDLELQKHVAQLLEEATQRCPNPSGAAAVVIDVATREIRALVSYPTYPYERFAEDYDALRRDTRHLPLLFRAVQGQYPPGSICKAISLVGALSDGLITAQTTFECRGHLLPDQPDRFRCWIYNQYPGMSHGLQDAEDAVRNSCNIYFFHVGERLGPQGLCDWFTRFGLGRSQGTGLIEESSAIVPTEDWMQTNRGRGYQPADAWNLAIGQGEVTVTPLQAANVAATIAAGFWAPVRLAYDSTGQALGNPSAAVVPLDDSALRVLRRGMWRVVNDQGTGREARLSSSKYELCGKTGSAQASPRVVNMVYTCEWSDGRREQVVATCEEDVLARFPADPPQIVARRVNERYPALEEGERLPAHAWFIGYTQPATTPRGGAPRGDVYAISVIIEFGGSGGHVAAPVARKIAEYLLP